MYDQHHTLSGKDSAPLSLTSLSQGLNTSKSHIWSYLLTPCKFSLVHLGCTHQVANFSDSRQNRPIPQRNWKMRTETLNASQDLIFIMRSLTCSGSQFYKTIYVV